MRTLPALRAPLPVLTDEVLALTAKLHPVEALARLAPIWAASTPGIAQRALLAARIALMRQAMTVEPVVEVVPEPEPEVVAVVERVVVPKPAPVNRGALTLLNLEDAAKLLMAGADDEADEAPPAVLRAEAEVAEVVAVEAAAVAMPVGAAIKARKSKAKRGDAAVASAAFDLAAQFADMAGDAGAVATPPLDLAAQFADIAEDAGAVAKQPLDLAAQFADMAGDAGAVAKPPLDLAAQFADMAGDAGAVAKPALDLAAQFAAMGDAGAEPEARPVRKAAGMGIDLSAQFAAMDGE